MSANKILVVGHRNPDFDSLVSAILLSKIFQKNQLNCIPAIFENDTIDEKTKKLISSFTDVNFQKIKDDEINDYYYILVDHNDVSQSTKNSRLVVCIVDHHQNKFWGDEEEFIFRTCGATASLIYDHFRDSYDFSDKEKELVALTLAFDTNFGKSNKYTEQDKRLFDELSPQRTMKEYFLEFFQESDMSSPEKILNSDAKEIKIMDYNYHTCSVSVKGKSKYNEFYKAIKNSSQPHELGIFHDIENNITRYIIKDERVLDTGSYDSYVSRETIVADIIKDKTFEETRDSNRF